MLALACSPEGEPTPDLTRLLSIGVELSQLLVELGAGPQVVATDSLSLATLPQLAHARDLGDADAPSLDAARAASPGRALLLAEGDAAAELAQALETGGIPTTLLSPADADEAVAAIHRLGRLLDLELRARALVARRTREVAEVAVRRDGRSRLRAAWVLQRDPLVVVGGAGMLHQLLELAGAENAFHGAPDPHRTVSPDALAASGAEVWIGAPPLPRPPSDVATIALDPALATLPLLDLPGRVRALHGALYPPVGDGAPATPPPARASAGPAAPRPGPR